MPRNANPTSAKSAATPKQAAKPTQSKNKAKPPKTAPDKVFENGAAEITLDLHEICEKLTV